jgi:ABC transporter with metal-binding/Fe-S-binding domain ATP-binding protein
LAALFSGGKDSTLAVLKAIELGHNVKYLATIHSKNPESYMWHTPNIGLTVIQSKCMNIPLVSKESSGEKEIEVKDLKILLEGLDVDGVVCGAIASEYQKKRVEKVCRELKLKVLTPLWGNDPRELLKEIIERKFEVIITAVSAEGFDRTWLGRKIDENCIRDLLALKKKFDINLAFEGGEAETAVLDCPLFKKRIVVKNYEVVWEGDRGIFNIKDVELIQK